MSIQNRIAKLEKNTPPQRSAPSMTDEARMERMKQLAQAIATEARTQGMTAQDDPCLSLPLAIAEVTKWH